MATDTAITNDTRMKLVAQDGTIYIREFRKDDITSSYLSWLNDSELMKFSNQRFFSHTTESSFKYACSFHNTAGLFLAICDDRDQLVGTMTAYRNTNHRTVDLGIMIGSEFKGRGFGKRAWETLINHLETDGETRKITAGCLDKNLAMINLINGCQMTLEGRRVGQEIFEGQPSDILLFGKIIRSYS